jgi:hypothetical protein
MQALDLMKLTASLPKLPEGSMPGYYLVGATPVLAIMDEDELPSGAYRYDATSRSFIADAGIAGDILTSGDCRELSLSQFIEAVAALTRV